MGYGPDHAAVSVQPATAAATMTAAQPRVRDGSMMALVALIVKWARLCSLWFTGTEKWKARGFAVLVVSLSFVNTLFMVRISYAQRNFSTALSGKDVPGFYKAVWEFAVIICIAVPLFTLNTFLEDRLVLAWRAYLTRHLLAAYFDNRSYFHLRQQLSSPNNYTNSNNNSVSKDASAGPHPFSAPSSPPLGSGPGMGSSTPGLLDNPDQRICDDVGAFCRSSTSITLALIKKVMNCAAFASVLWSISPSLVVFLFAYALLGTAATTGLFGHVLTSLYFKLLAQEGDLRFSLVRVRENAESIAFYRGDAQEHRVVSGRFASVLKTAADRIKWTALYDMWTSVYNYATILAPSLIVGPRYFRGEVEFGVISQASFAFSSIDSALSVIINNLAQLSGLAAETDRLDALRAALLATSHQQWSCLSRSDGIHSCRAQPGEVLRLERLCVQVPGSGVTIWRDLDLVLTPGQSLLIVGPSGCGKSSLLRALAGLWNQGSGSVMLPAASEVFFLPQKPFMPLGTLRQQLCFPSGVGGSHTSSADGPAGADGSAGPRHASPDDSLPLTSGGHGLIHRPPASKQTPVAGAGGQGQGSMAGTAPVTVTAAAALGSQAAARGSAGKSSRRGMHSKGYGASDSEGEGGGEAAGTGDVELAPLLMKHQTSSGARVASGAGDAAPGEGGAGTSPGASRVLHRQGSMGQSQEASVSDATLAQLLDDACLPDLLDRVGSLDTDLDWSHVLSSGEQQRVAFVRLLLHRPRLAFLDEATSAMDTVSEAKLYELLAQRLPCYVSVGHRMQLVSYHTHVLEHGGSPGCSWTLYTAQEYQQRLNRAAQ